MRRRGLSRAMRGAAAGSVLLAVAVSAARDARAEEPVTSAEPRLMRETGEMTSVVDAFDDGDPFDVNISLGFRYRSRSAPIERETVGGLARLGTFRQGVSTLDIGADVGLFRDVALLLRLPLILNDSRSLEAVGQGGSVPGGENETLFNTPFTSPTRSGVDDIGIGIDAGIVNQERNPRQPTWVVGVEARLAMGTALHACNQDAKVPCPDPWGAGAGAANAAASTTSRDPGVSRAVNTLRAHTVLSRRFGSLEPFAGFRGQVSFAESRSDYGIDSAGTADQSPPWLATALLGVEVIPWEHREQFQRLVGLLRASGTYHARGRDYSELFDALGSSSAPSLRAGSPTAYHGLMTGGASTSGNGQPASVADPNAPLAYFTGISSVEAHADLELAAEGTWQAGETIKFALGGSMTFTEAHLVTGADACNTRAQESAASAGPCGVNDGSPNPQERDAVNLPGHRFRVGMATTFDLFIRGVVMF